MATIVAEATGQAILQEEHEQSFLSKYIFSTDHKVIAIQFLIYTLFFLMIGGLLAMLMRYQIAWPARGELPLGGIFPESMVASGYILPEFYNALVTMHGSVMVFLAIMPMLVGVWANYLIPLQLGTHDMAFPRLNMLSFWAMVPAGILTLASFFVVGGAAGAGWTLYAPLSARPDLSGVGLGQILWLAALGWNGLWALMAGLTLVRPRDSA